MACVGYAGELSVAASVAVELEGSSARAVEQAPSRVPDRPHLGHELLHVLGARARRCLIGHRADPFDPSSGDQAVHRHQHQADGAVAADEIPQTSSERPIDDRAVDRIQDDHGVVLHAQGTGRVDPVPGPAGGSEARVHVVRVVTALAAQHDVEPSEVVDVRRVQQRRRPLADVGSRGSHLGSGEEDRREIEREVVLLPHAVDEHAAHHATPADETDPFHARTMLGSERSPSPAPGPRGVPCL